MLGGLDDGAVAGDVRHRAQRVHLLGARDARHAIHRQRGHAAVGQRLEEFGILRGPDEADQRLPGPQHVELVTFRRPHLYYYLALFVDVLRRQGDLAAGILVGVIRKTGRGARAALYDNAVAEFHQLGRGLRGGRDASLPRQSFSWYTDFHSILPLSRGGL